LDKIIKNNKNEKIKKTNTRKPEKHLCNGANGDNFHRHLVRGSKRNIRTCKHGDSKMGIVWNFHVDGSFDLHQRQFERKEMNKLLKSLLRHDRLKHFFFGFWIFVICDLTKNLL